MCKSYIYFVQRADGAIKIGRSKHPRLRIATLTAEYGDLIELGFIREGSGVTEDALHRKFMGYRIEGEWFRNAPFVTAFVREYASESIEAALPDTYVEV